MWRVIDVTHVLYRTSCTRSNFIIDKYSWADMTRSRQPLINRGELACTIALAYRTRPCLSLPTRPAVSGKMFKRTSECTTWRVPCGSNARYISRLGWWCTWRVTENVCYLLTSLSPWTALASNWFSLPTSSAVLPSVFRYYSHLERPCSSWLSTKRCHAQFELSALVNGCISDEVL